MKKTFLLATVCLLNILPACNKESKGSLPAPANLKVSQADADKLAFVWDKVSGAEKYEYLLSTDNGGDIKGAQGSTTTVTKTFYSLKPASDYTFQVRATKDGSNSEWASVKAKTAAVGPDPGPDPDPDPKPDPSAKYDQFKIPASEDVSHKDQAFPGAEGGGMFATGGRGGDVYHVTNLNDSGSGSLREGLKRGNRIIVFDVAGIIELQSALKIEKDNITVAGQTAPGDGICLKNYTFRIAASNVIVRFIRTRMGDEKQTEDDAMNCFYNESGDPKYSNIIVDHCSMSWSTDECGSFYGSRNFTLQWSILSESLTNSVHGKGAHGYGGIWGGQTASFHHNLLAHHSNRTPRLCGSRYSNQEDKEQVEIVNNVYYNWTGEGAYAGQGGSYNMLGNYYKPGPASAAKGTHCRFFTPYPDDGTNHQAKGVCGKFWLEGNFMDGSVSTLTNNQKKEIDNANADNFASTAFVPKSGITECTQADFKAAGKFTISNNGSKVTVQEAKKAFESVLAYSGACAKRDEVDTRIVKETKEGSYSCKGSNGGTNGLIDTQADAGGWPAYKASADELEKVADTDKDGMPDWFEDEFGLDKNSAADGKTKTLDKYQRYTNVEMYLHYLVRDIVDGQYK